MSSNIKVRIFPIELVLETISSRRAPRLMPQLAAFIELVLETVSSRRAPRLMPQLAAFVNPHSGN